ncbi:cytochrome c oxidase assembly protein [Sphingomonas quercus]|uniref:Cytochrome c oxidase assembly protein CtaG n=1 Tax=Sphingomonas quercus TaxID=2842451 RepID=A0ABS6BIL4_9SPHN|nr:cytochrome c oxidase assembly protein [Sphingomonas quercus]MBU3078149.1 cytochrome c oxidase assembly protein [Sphingomonas quercus]
MGHAIDRNARTGLIFAAVAAGMVGLGFAAVPFYRMFCQATGYDGTARIDVNAHAPGAVGKIINVRFDSNVSPKLKWRFAPEEGVERVAVGARKMAFFNATNLSDHTVTGTAAFNVTPDQAGQYFVKIQCFCFTKQTLKPGETVRMPVVYYVDPALLKDEDAKDISEITLSYTFYPVDQTDSAG